MMLQDDVTGWWWYMMTMMLPRKAIHANLFGAKQDWKEIAADILRSLTISFRGVANTTLHDDATWWRYMMMTIHDDVTWWCYLVKQSMQMFLVPNRTEKWLQISYQVSKYISFKKTYELWCWLLRVATFLEKMLLTYLLNWPLTTRVMDFDLP